MAARTRYVEISPGVFQTEAVYNAGGGDEAEMDSYEHIIANAASALEEAQPPPPGSVPDQGQPPIQVPYQAGLHPDMQLQRAQAAQQPVAPQEQAPGLTATGSARLKEIEEGLRSLGDAGAGRGRVSAFPNPSLYRGPEFVNRAERGAGLLKLMQAIAAGRG